MSLLKSVLLGNGLNYSIIKRLPFVQIKQMATDLYQWICLAASCLCNLLMSMLLLWQCVYIRIIIDCSVQIVQMCVVV